MGAAAARELLADPGRFELRGEERSWWHPLCTRTGPPIELPGPDQWRHGEKGTEQTPTTGAAMRKRSHNAMLAAEGDVRGKNYERQYSVAKRRLQEARREWVKQHGWALAVPAAMWPKDPQKKDSSSSSSSSSSIFRSFFVEV